MAENRGGGGPWGAEGTWWTAEQQHQLVQQMQAQHQQNLETALSTACQTQLNPMYTYKMANSSGGGGNAAAFQNNSGSVQDNGSAYGGAGLDYSQMAGGGHQQQQQQQQQNWWGYQSQGQDLHGGLQGLQNMTNQQSIHNQVQQQAQSRQEEAQRQEVNRQHQEAVQRQQQEEYRQHQEAIQQHQQAITEAQARHHQLQQLHNSHHQVLQFFLQQQQLTQSKGRMPKKADARPRGRMTAYAFFVQTCREEHKKKHPEENVVFAEFSKKCAERWKTMLDKEKKRFHEMAENDKKRYDTEMQSYTPPKGEKQRGKKRKQQKDPNAPKRSLSAFFWFSNDERGKVKAQNPEYGVGDIAKELGRRWAEADAETRSKYEALADKDKIRYEKEMTAYKKKNNPALQQQVPDENPEDDEDAEEEEDE
ncbi:uncharacterized protein LOC143191469 isoform X2 [Rhynchophorus ferrugineus]|uniref:uncharacterized protein LOC143191469 isoform X2 n=1 Tax=Rhynchophorus ferrugineus TaxID=354439 RepID=UPI003FCE8204